MPRVRRLGGAGGQNRTAYSTPSTLPEVTAGEGEDIRPGTRHQKPPRCPPTGQIIFRPRKCPTWLARPPVSK